MERKIGLWDLPDNIYVLIEGSSRLSFFNHVIKKSGGTTKLARFLEIKSRRNIYSYKNAESFTPLRIIKRMLSLIPERRQHFIRLIENNIKMIKTKSSSKPIVNPKLPITFSSDFGRLAGHIIGDGGIFYLKGTYIAHYSNKSKFLIDQFRDCVKSIFGEVEIYEYRDKRKNAYRLSVSSFIGLVLSIFLGKQNGDSKDIPGFIIESNRYVRANFLSALFDDEGSINGRSINISLSNKNAIIKLIRMLEEFDIKIGKITESKKNKINYRFSITGRNNINHFARKINFSHPFKEEKLRNLIDSYVIDRYEKNEMEKLILELLRKNERMDIYEISKRIGRKPEHRIRKRLITMEKNGLLKSEKGDLHRKIYHLNC